MQLPIVIAVLAAFVAAHSTSPAASIPTWKLVVAGLAGLLGPITAWAGCLRLAATTPRNRGALFPAGASSDALGSLDLAARCESLEKWVFGLWLLGILAMFTLGQWVAGVQSLANVRAWFLGLELAAIAPVSGSLLAIWAAFYWLEERLHWLHRGQRVPGTSRNLIRFLWLQARQQLGLLVVPPLALAGLVELATRTGLVQEVSLHGQTAARDGWWVVIVPLGMVLGMPVILRRLWKTTPLPEGPLRRELLACCQAERCPVSEVLLWHTGMRQANAAVVGLVPRLRYVLISDRLLALLTRGELLAVLRHELSHLKRGHLLLRLAVLVLPAAGWLVVGPSGGSSGSSSGVERPAVATRFGGDPLWAADQHAVVLPPRWASLGFPVAMLAYGLLVVGGYSRWLEHEADLEACLDAERRFDPRAAEDLADALRVVVGREEGGWLIAWLHPPLSSRLAFLRRAAGDAAFVRRFRWRLRSAAVVVLVLWLAIGWMAVRGH